jgi:hypothetical protein
MRQAVTLMASMTVQDQRVRAVEAMIQPTTAAAAAVGSEAQKPLKLYSLQLC